MTDTITPTEQVLRVSPSTLIIEDNIRRTVKLDPAFVSSIKQHGVLVPILVDAGETPGTWHVIDGQLRTLAAIDTSRTDVPIITQGNQSDPDRLLEQLIINDHRAGITESDRNATYQTLFEMGVSADKLSRKTNVPKKRIETALAVAGSKYAAEILSTGNVTLEQAAALLEFEDIPELAEQLGTIVLETPNRFAHALNQARTKRRSDEERAALVEELTEAGYVITDEFESHVRNATACEITHLYRDEARNDRLADKSTDRIPPFDGLKAVLRQQYQWDHENETHNETWVALFIVDGWQDLGFFAPPYVTEKRTEAAEGGGLTDEQKAERKETRENNKLWVPASEVRRTWLTELLQRKDLPAGWELFVAKYVARQSAEGNYTFTLVLLGAEQQINCAKWLETNPARAGFFLLAAAIASIEGAYEFSKSGWRHPLAQEYIAQLSKWGYGLSDLEETVSKKTSR